MTGSRISAAFAAALTALAVAFAAAAQEAEGVPDGPARPPVEVEDVSPPTEAAAEAERPGAPLPLVPRSILPDLDAEDGAGAAPAPDRRPRGDEVEIDQLGAVDVESVGLIGDREGGLGRDMWRGSDRGFVAMLLHRLPTAAPSPAMRALTRRLLLTSADAPAGRGASLLEPRLAALLEIGELEALDSLLDMAARRSPLVTIDRIRAERLLLGGGVGEVCPGLPTLLSRDNDPYWQRMLIVCQTIAGDRAAALLGLDLLREQADSDRVPGFAPLVRAILDDTPLPGGGLHLTPQTAALIAATRDSLPVDTAAAGTPAVWRALADDPDLGLETRIAAAERGARSGAVAAADLDRLYQQVEATPEEIEAALDEAGAGSGPIDRALRFQAARSRTDPVARAESLRWSWRMASPPLDYFTAARTGTTVILSLPAAPGLVRFAPDAVVVLLASGRADAAAAWFRLLRDRAADDPEVAVRFASLAPFMAIAGGGGVVAWDEGTAVDWYAALPEELEEEERQRRARRMFAVLESLGRPLGRDVWSMLLDAPSLPEARVPEAAVTSRLQDAAAAGRVGEAVTLALLVLGEGGPAAAGAHALGAAVGALHRVGLAEDAARIALEAVLSPPD